MEGPTTRETLIRRFGGGDRQAWDEFYHLYKPLIRMYVSRFGLREFDLDDLVEDLFLKLRERLAAFKLDPAKGRFRAWLRTVVDNSVRDWLDRPNRAERPGPNPEPPPPESNEDRWRRLEWRRAVLAVVMERVRGEFQGRDKTLACFEKLTLEGRSAKEVAAELGIEKVNNVYVYSHRVLQRVRQLCAEYDEELDDAPEAGPDGQAL